MQAKTRKMPQKRRVRTKHNPSTAMRSPSPTSRAGFKANADSAKGAYLCLGAIVAPQRLKIGLQKTKGGEDASSSRLA